MICRRPKTKNPNHPWRKTRFNAKTYNAPPEVPLLDEDLDMLPIMQDYEVIEMQVKENSYG